MSRKRNELDMDPEQDEPITVDVTEADAEPEAVTATDAPEPVDPEAGWLLCKALENLGGGGRFVAKGETYKQPPDVARSLAKRGYVVIVE